MIISTACLEPQSKDLLCFIKATFRPRPIWESEARPNALLRRAAQSGNNQMSVPARPHFFIITARSFDCGSGNRLEKLTDRLASAQDDGRFLTVPRWVSPALRMTERFCGALIDLACAQDCVTN